MSWIQTRWARERIYPLDLQAQSVDIHDIAHSLSMTCRWGGHTGEFYSVAQHSFLVSCQLDDDLALAGLLHDAAEAYLPDIAAPIKGRVSIDGVPFDVVEARLLRVIFEALNVAWPTAEGWAAIKHADRVLLAWEARDLMDICDPVWGHGLPDPPDHILPVARSGAHRAISEQFLRAFHKLTESPR